jgi:hypothetical protein
MRMNFVLTVILIISFGAGVMAQDSKDDKEKMAVDLYLQNPELMIIKEQSLSNDRQTKLQSLDGIEKMIKDGKVNTEVENMLIYLG